MSQNIYDVIFLFGNFLGFVFDNVVSSAQNESSLALTTSLTCFSFMCIAQVVLSYWYCFVCLYVHICFIFHYFRRC